LDEGKSIVRPRNLNFTYDFDILPLGGPFTPLKPIRGVVLIHPIGVGIGKWFYARLLNALNEQCRGEAQQCLVIVPDLLGCASACEPVIVMMRSSDDNDMIMKHTPLLNITDWSSQVANLMGEIETQTTTQDWSVVGNGGCAPIALQVAAMSVEQYKAPFQKNVTNVVISSPPRLPFLESTDPDKVAKWYRTLCGVPGRLFWWYSSERWQVHPEVFREIFGG
jgi:hypothetical protein